MKTLLFLCLCLLTAGAVYAQDEPDTLTVSHVNHAAARITCTKCHPAEVDPASAAPRATMAACSACHHVQEKDICVICHTNTDKAGHYPRREPRTLFTHGPHLDQGIACTVCHGDNENGNPVMPVKTDCRVCHETADDYADCRLCHRAEDELLPVSHRSNWLYAHGVQARADESACYLCHSRNTCQDCHAGDNVRPRSHGLNFAFEHAVKARGREMDCITCHQDPEYCSACHLAENVLPGDHFRAGWVRLPDGGDHATAGLFDMESCVACHSAGEGSPMCARCHGG